MKKKLVIISIFSVILMMSMPMISNIQAQPILLSKNKMSSILPIYAKNDIRDKGLQYLRWGLYHLTIGRFVWIFVFSVMKTFVDLYDNDDVNFLIFLRTFLKNRRQCIKEDWHLVIIGLYMVIYEEYPPDDWPW